MKRIIIYTLTVITATTFLISCGGARKKQDGSDGGTTSRSGSNFVALISDSLINQRGADTIDFGRVREGEQLVRELQIKNADNKAMVITRVDLSCGCVQLDYPKQPIKPGEKGEIKITLDTRNLGGWIFKTAVIQTSLTHKPYVLYLTAEVGE